MRSTVTTAEIRSWPSVVPLWPDAASALGVGRSAAYDLVRRGEWPCRVLRLGRQLRVPTAELMAALGIPIDPTHDEAPVSASTASGAPVVHLPHVPEEKNCANHR